MKTILEVQNLYKSFEDIRVLDQINLTVGEGDFLAIMGQSGSGKSTLLYSISGMDRPTSGRVVFCGNDISGLDDEEMSELRLNRMGFIFQQPFLLKNLSIRDNIVLPGFRANVLPRDRVNQNAGELMEKTGIVHVTDHDIKKVSGGQLQRASICRALINQPDILFGDEPTGALNSSATREVMDIVNRINGEGRTVILVTHDAKVAARADRVIFLADGRISDELVLGKYGADESGRGDSGEDKLVESEKESASREKRLSGWLEGQGF